MTVEVDGINQYVDLPNLDVPAGLDELTLMAFVFPRDVGSDERILSKASGTSKNAHLWMLGIGVDSGVKFRIRTIGTTQSFEGGTVTQDAWSHLAGRYDGSSMTGFINGVEVGTPEAENGLIDRDSGVDVWIGGNPPTTNRQFDGLIMDVRAYARAVTLGEIETIVETKGRDGIVQSLLWRWMLDEGYPGQVATAFKNIGPVSGADGVPMNDPVYRESPYGFRRRAA